MYGRKDFFKKRKNIKVEKYLLKSYKLKQFLILQRVQERRIKRRILLFCQKFQNEDFLKSKVLKAAYL